MLDWLSLRGVPCDGAAAGADETSALGARGGLGFTPEVVVEGVDTGNDIVPLTAEVGTLLEGCRGSRSSSAEKGDAGEDGELHSFGEEGAKSVYEESTRLFFVGDEVERL